MYATYWTKRVNSGESHQDSFISSSTNISNSVITTPANCYALHFNIASAYGTTYQNDISINNPSTDTAYHAYTGTTVTIALGQTVYGGELDVTSGVLTITHGIYSYDGTESFNLVGEGTTGRRFTNAFSHDQKSDVGIFSHGILANRNIGVWGEFRVLASGYLAVLDNTSNFATVSDLQIYLATQYANGTPFQACYELAHPVTVQLTPTEIETLLGTNNIWSDTGDTTVRYRVGPDFWLVS